MRAVKGRPVSVSQETRDTGRPLTRVVPDDPGQPRDDPWKSNGTRPWVAHYKQRKTNRTARCGVVTPPDHHRCRWPVQPGTTTCAMHAPEET
jgi:hypothetical protein